jgi:hypothetical protein
VGSAYKPAAEFLQGLDLSVSMRGFDKAEVFEALRRLSEIYEEDRARLGAGAEQAPPVDEQALRARLEAELRSRQAALETEYRNKMDELQDAIALMRQEREKAEEDRARILGTTQAELAKLAAARADAIKDVRAMHDRIGRLLAELGGAL